MAGRLQGLADRTDATVHHVRGRYHLGAGLGVGQRLPYQHVDADVVEDVAIVIQDAVLAMGGERVERHVGDDAQLRKALAQGAGGALGDAFRVVCLGGVQGLLLHRGHREQRQRRNAQGHPLFRLDQQLVDGQALDAGHRRNAFTLVDPIKDEHRQDQVVDGEDILADQAAGEVIAAIAPQAGVGIGAVGGSEAHGFTPGPR